MVVKSQSQSRSSFGSLAAAGAIAAIIAAVADVVVYSIARASGVSMVMPYRWGQPPAVLPISIIVSTVVVAAVLATITFGLLVSFAGLLSLAQTAGSTKAALVAMHIWQRRSGVMERMARINGCYRGQAVEKLRGRAAC